MKVNLALSARAGTNKRRGSQGGFTLVELMVVIAILLVLLTLTSAGLKTMSGATTLNGSSDVISGIFAFARQEAISKNTVVAVVIDTDLTTGDAAYRLMGVWEWVATTGSGGSWTQASRWRMLPTGIVIDKNTSYLASSDTVNPAISSATITSPKGTLATGSYISYVFLPSGRIVGPPSSSTLTQCTFRLVEGFYASSTATAVTLTHPGSNNGVANYVQYYFNTSTGEAKVVRP